MPSSEQLADLFFHSAGPRLARLYGEHQALILVDELISDLQHFAASADRRRAERWDQRDVILISYGDSLREEGRRPLQVLQAFLAERLGGLISTVHILPFFPFSSDDGFSVIDYRSVNPTLGDWDDIRTIGETCDLMMDLVINHVSRESLWFNDFVNARPPACYYFIEMDPSVDLSAVVRPRKSNVLTPVHTRAGLKHVWSTFSEDQIDVNFANPNVLREYLRILLFYLGQGARFIRLDAVAFLWKKLGTGCINLPETHDVVKLLRSALDLVAPDVVLLTETNLPSNENLSYFGAGDEAHMVYQFSLPPLLLHALHRGTSRYLNQWAATRCDPPAGCTFLNFTASHDGIGLRPAEGLLPGEEINALIESMRQFGGFVSMRSNRDGTDSPYEINIALYDALRGTYRGVDQWQLARLICSQAVMLSLKGIPALYIHSLLATPNDLAGVEKTGRTRSINRRSWRMADLEPLLDNPHTPNAVVFRALSRLLEIRQAQPAFHPDAGQEILPLGEPFFAVRRHSVDGRQQLLALANLTDRPQALDSAGEHGGVTTGGWHDLIADQPCEDPSVLVLQPYQVVWLSSDD